MPSFSPSPPSTRSSSSTAKTISQWWCPQRRSRGLKCQRTLNAWPRTLCPLTKRLLWTRVSLSQTVSWTLDSPIRQYLLSINSKSGRTQACTIARIYSHRPHMTLPTTQESWRTTTSTSIRPKPIIKTSLSNSNTHQLPRPRSEVRPTRQDLRV